MAKTETLHLRLTPEIKEWLERIAEKNGITLSTYVFSLLTREMNKNKQQPTAQPVRKEQPKRMTQAEIIDQMRSGKLK